MQEKSMRSIQEKAEQLRQTWEQIAHWRKTWTERTKPLIINTLEAIQQATPLDWYVGRNEQTQNLEAVYLSLNESESGIVERADEGLIPLAKQGGYICFSQLLNGIVQVWVSFPTIDKILEQQPDTPLANFTPDDIDEKVVVECVEKFLEVLMIWEVGENHVEKKRKIGFVKE